MSARGVTGPSIVAKAIAASSALVLAGVAVTGVFIAKIVNLSPAGSAGSTSGTDNSGGGLGNFFSDNGNSQLGPAQPNQAPLSGSHGS